jgi:hypothetical protein
MPWPWSWSCWTASTTWNGEYEQTLRGIPDIAVEQGRGIDQLPGVQPLDAVLWWFKCKI